MRGKRLQWVPLLLLLPSLTLGLTWAGCSRSQTTPAPAQQQVLVYAVSSDWVLDPHVRDYEYDNAVQWAAYERLVQYEAQSDGTVKIVPALAKRWEMSPDGKVFTFYLQDNVKFHDGTPCDAEAVKLNFERLKGLNRAPAGRLPPISSIEVLDRSTVRITLEKPYPNFIHVLTKQPCIVSPSAWKAHEKDGDWGSAWLSEHMVGTGPFKLDQLIQGQEARFVRNPDYWRGWEGKHLDGVVVKVVKDPATRRMMLANGDAHIAQHISRDDVPSLKTTPGVVVEEHPSTRMVHIYIRNRGVLKDKRVRQALAYAFDYEGFINGPLKGMAIKPKGPIAQGFWPHTPNVKEYSYDLEKAKALLTDAGVFGKPLKLTMLTFSGYAPYGPQEAQILQASLSKLGIELAVEDRTDGAAFFALLRDYEKGPDLLHWEQSPAIDDPNLNFMYYYRTGARNNFTGYSNPQVDALLDEVVVTADRSRAEQLYHEVQRIISEDCPAIWTAQLKEFFVQRQEVRGRNWSPFDTPNGPDYYRMWLEK